MKRIGIALVWMLSALAGPLEDVRRLAREGADALDAGPVREAIALLEGMPAAKEGEEGPRALELARAYDALWTCLEEAGDAKGVREVFPKAVAAAEKAAARLPESAEAHALLGDLCGRSIDLRGPMAGMTWGPRAEKEILRALELDPRCVYAHLAWGRNRLFAPAMFGGSAEKAVEAFRRAVALDPASAEASYWLGKGLQDQGKGEEAKAAFRKALELHPRFALARKAMGGTQEPGNPEAPRPSKDP